MWRVRISVLWIADVVALAAAFTLVLFEPGHLDELINGRVEGMEINLGVLLLTSFFWLVPLLMMYFSLVLNIKVLRRLNIILGIILALMNLFDFLSQLPTLGAIGVARAIFIALMAIIPAMIAWQNWKYHPESFIDNE